jgi:hypothetical protein
MKSATDNRTAAPGQPWRQKSEAEPSTVSFLS